MLSIERCKEILNKGIRKFTNDEIKEIRDHLYLIAEIDTVQRSKKNLAPQLNYSFSLLKNLDRVLL